MKINFLLPHLRISGGGRAILTYADILARKGHDVTVVVQSRSWLRRNAANLINLKPSWFKNLHSKALRVKNFDESNMPKGDIVMSTSWNGTFAMENYSRNMGEKFYLVQHYESLYHKKDKGSDFVDRAYSLPFKKIVISTWLKDIMKEKFNFDSEVIVTPVDSNLFHFIESMRKDAPIRVLMLHHTFEWKGTKKGKLAFDRVKKEFPDIQLVLFGVRSEKVEMECDEYFYNPKQEDLAKIYSSCQIFLCPSEYEGLGMPAMEAMACKCAVATFDTGGSRDYAIDGQTALVAKQGDVDKLAEKLKMLVADERLREQIAESGYNFIRNNFSWEKAADKMEEIFKKAVEKNARRH